MNEQLELIRQDINFIDKYKDDAGNLIGLTNDMLFHLKSAEIHYTELLKYKKAWIELKEICPNVYNGEPYNTMQKLEIKNNIGGDNNE